MRCSIPCGAVVTSRPFFQSEKGAGLAALGKGPNFERSYTIISLFRHGIICLGSGLCGISSCMWPGPSGSSFWALISKRRPRAFVLKRGRAARFVTKTTQVATGTTDIDKVQGGHRTYINEIAVYMFVDKNIRISACFVAKTSFATPSRPDQVVAASRPGISAWNSGPQPDCSRYAYGHKNSAGGGISAASDT